MKTALILFFGLGTRLFSQNVDTTFYHTLLVVFAENYVKKQCADSLKISAVQKDLARALRADSIKRADEKKEGKKRNDTILFDRIFGGTRDFNNIMLTTEAHHSVTWSRENCWLKCTDGRGKEKWTRDLSKLNCELICFSLIRYTKVKGCDIFFQLKDERYFLLNSRNGRIRFLPKPELKKYYSIIWPPRKTQIPRRAYLW